MAPPEITNVLAEALVTDHAAAVEWYTALFDRPPDRRPMGGLAEWQLNPTGGRQVFERAEGAGSSFVTFIVDMVTPVTDHLASIGIDTEIQTGLFRVLDRQRARSRRQHAHFRWQPRGAMTVAAPRRRPTAPQEV